MPKGVLRNKNKGKTWEYGYNKKYDVVVFVVAHPTKMYKGQDGRLKNLQCITLKVVVNGTMLVITDY